MSFKLQANFEKKVASDNNNNYIPMVNDDKFIENMRKLVKDYLDIVSRIKHFEKIFWRLFIIYQLTALLRHCIVLGG